MRSRRRSQRQLTKAELRAAGATPGLLLHKVGPDGRARLEQLTAEASGQPSLFLRSRPNSRLATNEEGGGA